MDLIDVDVIGAQAAQRIIDLPQDPLPGRISVDLAVAPFQSHLGRNDGLRTRADERLADDLLGAAKAVRGAVSMRLMPSSKAALIVATDSRSSVPPHIHPPIARYRALPGRPAAWYREYPRIRFRRPGAGPVLTLAWRVSPDWTNSLLDQCA